MRERKHITTLSDPVHLTYDVVSRYLAYDPKTGWLTWLERPIRPGYEFPDKTWNSRQAGTRAGCVTPYGYRTVGITVDGAVEEKVLAHRLAWLLHYREWPARHVDHKNRKRDDNWIDNLRLATWSENLSNAKLRKDNTSGVKGVSFQKARNKWRARLNLHKKQVYYGYFDTMDEAIEARRDAARRLLGEFANET